MSIIYNASAVRDEPRRRRCGSGDEGECEKIATIHSLIIGGEPECKTA